jgi:hypothetical protein
MKLLNRLKYKLWRWLMDDLCAHSGTIDKCIDCECAREKDCDNVGTCYQDFVYRQAYRVWMIEEMLACEDA